MKYRVIWIDDERDPRKQMPFGICSWWEHKVPCEFRKLIGDEEPEIVWLKSYDQWLDWYTGVLHNEPEGEYTNCFCLDHDLASFDEKGNEKTGVHVAHDIVGYCLMCGRIFPFYECHSSNPAGKEDIISVFETYKKVLKYY